jgi:hypothetical protein
VLGAGKPLRAREGDVDRLRRQCRVAWSGGGRQLQQTFNQRLERLEALAHRLFCLCGCGLEPAAGNLVEQSLLAAQPAQAKSLNRVRTAQRSRIVACPLLDRAERFVQRSIIKCGEIGYLVIGIIRVHHA